jgi:hypothetical protein
MQMGLWDTNPGTTSSALIVQHTTYRHGGEQKENRLKVGDWEREKKPGEKVL